jgi:endonuclease/exonuclease/phosphatase family metal-dependent hydrolase
MTQSHPDHEHWHGNIGEPVVIDVGDPLPHDAEIDVLSWNIAIGNGRLIELVEKIRAGVFDGIQRPDTRPLIILAQEAYRADMSVPEHLRSLHHGGKDPKTSRFDIVSLANELGFSLRYAPSMRNGRHRSDRGNAILTNCGIASWHSFALPHVRQMRIALAIQLAGVPWLTFACAHLDTRGRVRAGGDAAIANIPGRMAQATALGERLIQDLDASHTTIIGADLNSYFGVREPLFKGLINAGFHRIPHMPIGGHTFHSTPIRMLLDHILVRGPGLASMTVTRLDEDPRCRGRTIFGSDHHPLLARITLDPQNRSGHSRGED